MIAAHGLGYAVGGRSILRMLDFAVSANDFVLIIGQNGAGKSTLLRALAGLLPGLQGAVTIDGRNLKLYSRRELATRLSYLPQSDEFALPLLVEDVLLAGRYPYRSLFRRQAPGDREALAAGVAEFDLGELLQRNMQTLSGGEKKKVLLASAFIQDVPLILLDEPLNYLDPGSAARLVKALAALRQKGKTILVVSHDVEKLFPHANKLWVLKSGTLLYAGDRVFSPELLRQAYGVSYQRTFAGKREILFADE